MPVCATRGHGTRAGPFYAADLPGLVSTALAAGDRHVFQALGYRPALAATEALLDGR